MSFEVMERRCDECGTFCPCSEHSGKNYCLPCFANKLKAENEQLKTDVANYHQLQWQHDALIDENEKLKAELQTKCNKLRYALARLRWAHAQDMESMIDQLYTERPSSWRFYHKSTTYWYNKWQELKKEPKEGK